MATFTNNNTRVFYAMKAVAIGPIGATSIEDSSTALDGSEAKCRIVHGLQSMGITTNFNLEQAFEFGQLSIYENIEEVPDVEVTMEKVLDGYSLLYHLGTPAATTPLLTGRADSRADVRMAIVGSTEDAVTSGDSAVAELYCSGMYLSSVSYSLPTDGNFTESVSFVGNNKKWITASTDTQNLLVGVSDTGVVSAVFAAIFGSNSPASTNIQRRQHFIDGTTGKVLGGTTFKTYLPADIGGIAATSGGSDTVDVSNTHIQSINISTDLGRESINHLGAKDPYNRYVSFPTEVTCEIEVIATRGDDVTAVGSQETSQLSNRWIQIVCEDSTVMQLGIKNKLSSVNYGGGDAGGGNDTITYSYSNFNDFTILHSGDPLIGNAGYAGTYWQNHYTVV